MNLVDIKGDNTSRLPVPCFLLSAWDCVCLRILAQADNGCKDMTSDPDVHRMFFTTLEEWL